MHERARRFSGFTLIEMIVVMVLISAMVAVSAVFIVQPFLASEDLERRAGLVDAVDLALSRMVDDVRYALPNSVRVDTDGGAEMLEFISVVTGARYRRLPGGGETDTFVPARTSDSFNVVGNNLQGFADVTAASAGACGTGAVDCVSIYNMPAASQPDYSVYHGNNRARVTAVADDSVTYDQGTFNTHSPSQRFYIFNTPVSYVCSGGELRRYRDYGINATQQVPGGTGVLIADGISDCSFDYREGTATRRGLLTMRLTAARGGETVTLLVQAQVSNTP